MIEIFQNKKNYKVCKEYLEKNKMIKTIGFDYRGNKTIKELNNYFYSLKQLYNNMKSKGYISQNNLKKNLEDEIGVFIDRNGRIIKPEDKYGGTHRFAISKILKIKSVYVRVRAVHMDYLKKIYFKKKKLNNFDKALLKNIKKFI